MVTVAILSAGYYHRIPLIPAQSEITYIKIILLKLLQYKYDDKLVLLGIGDKSGIVQALMNT